MFDVIVDDRRLDESVQLHGDDVPVSLSSRRSLKSRCRRATRQIVRSAIANLFNVFKMSLRKLIFDNSGLVSISSFYTNSHFYEPVDSMAAHEILRVVVQRPFFSLGVFDRIES